MLRIDSLGYSVHFDQNLEALGDFLEKGQYSRVFVLVDRNTGEHCLPVLQSKLPGFLDFDIIEIDPGEENKNIDFCIGVWSTLLDFGADRNSLLLNLGGGVVTDMGGFAASTYKRGIDFIQVPTTLLSQVDASVGGKTGIDMHAFKNVIGTFTQPQAVFICPDFLQTLEEREWRSGFAEVLKHGLILDAAYFDEIKNLSSIQAIQLENIQHSIALKNQIVLEDPYEKDRRKILNFGHTIGHAIEGYFMTQTSTPWLHGEAIAVGMICEAYLSCKRVGLAEADLSKITETFLRFYPKNSLPAVLDRSMFSDLIDIMKNDKKNEGDQIGFSLLTTIGKAEPAVFVSVEEIMESLEYYQDQ